MGQEHCFSLSRDSIVSPPLTPKRHLDSHFHNTIEKTISYFSSFLDPPPPSLINSSSFLQKKNPKTQIAFIVEPPLENNTAPSYRQKRKLARPPKTGFTMPIERVMKNTLDKSLLPNQARNYKLMNCATPKKVLRLAARRPAYWIDKGHSCLSTKDTAMMNHRKQDTSKVKRKAAHIFDQINADSDLTILFKDKEDWIPNVHVFENRSAIRIAWKGSPLKIHTMPYFEKLHPGEIPIASTLRLTPEQYLRCKYALILTAHKANEENTMFRRSEAQRACSIDVNKTSALWKVFGKLGWLGPKWPN